VRLRESYRDPVSRASNLGIEMKGRFQHKDMRKQEEDNLL